MYVVVLLTRYNFFASLVVSSLVFSLYLFGGNMCMRAGLFNKLMINFGNISFSVYLVHSIVIRGLILLGCKSFSLLLFATLVLTIAISSLTYLYIEKPFIKISKYIQTKCLN